MKTEVSIIIPVFNAVEYLPKCLDSILAQPYGNWECICVDDGSTDGSGELLDRYAERDARIVVRHESNGGAAFARNVALDIAGGEYVCFVDADDWIGDDIIGNAYAYAGSHGSDIVIWDCAMVEPTGLKQVRYSVYTEDCENLPAETLQEILRHLVRQTSDHLFPAAYPCSKLYRRSLFEDGKFDERLPLSEDRALNFRIYRAVADSVCGKISYLHRPGYYYRKHLDSSTWRFRSGFMVACMSYIGVMKEMAGGWYAEGTGREAWEMLWNAWTREVLNPQNPLSFFRRVGSFTSVVGSRVYRDFLSVVEDEKDLPLPRRIDLFLLRRGVTLLFWLRGFKRLVLMGVAR